MDIRERNKNLNKEYKLISQIGSGGMAEVFLAERKADNKKYAIKIVKPDRNDPNAIIRFNQELQLAKKINSRYVTKIYQAFIDEDADESWFAMEYINGSILKDHIESNGRLSPEETVRFSKQIALGFFEIHKHKIIHRDLKDSNIMISNLNEVKIIDFGIAISDESIRATSTGKIIGSVHYLAPEAAKHGFVATPQTDIYALGILMYQMLIGEHPFKGKDAFEIISKHKNSELPKIKNIRPNVPQPLINIILKATAKEAEKRYSSMKEIYLDLEDCLSIDRAAEPEINFNKKNKKSFFEIMSSKKSLIIISIIISIILLILAILIIVGFVI